MAKQSDISKAYAPDWLEKLDGRTRFAQVMQQRYQDLTADMGGLDALSYQQRSIAKRIVHLEALIEQQEAALAKGEDIDAGRLTNTTNTLIGLLKAIGLQRQAKDVPNLHDYLKQRATA